MKKNERVKRWELALALSLCITVFHGALFGTSGAAWWGVIFPGLTGEPESVQTAAVPGEEGVELRFRLLDWLRGAVEDR